MLLTPTQVQVTLDRQQHLRAAIARDCLVTATTHVSPTVPPRPVGRILTGLRFAIASLIALTTIG